MLPSFIAPACCPEHLHERDQTEFWARVLTELPDLFANPALAEVDIDGQSTFVTEGKDLAFGFTVESKKNDDIYFTLRVPTGVSWGAVGLGSEGMDRALILMIYVRFPAPSLGRTEVSSGTP